MPQPKRDLELAGKQLERWFATVLPDPDHVELSPLGGPGETGFSSDTLLFTVDWRVGSASHREDLVARLRPDGFNVFPEYDVARQYNLMKLMAERTNVPVPTMRWLVDDTSVLGTPFFVMDRVEGRIPTDQPPYNIGGWVHDLAPDDQARLWWNGLEAMTRVHALDWRELDLGYLAEPDRGATFLEQHLQYYHDFIDWGMERERYPLFARALRFLRGEAPKHEPDGLCWGDSRIANQIFDGFECAAVIDWEMARLGNPEADLGWWVGIDRCFSEGIGVERLGGLPSRAATIARWEDLTGRSAPNIDYYELFATFRFSVIMARLGLQMKHYGVLPADHEMDVVNLASATLDSLLGQAGD